MSNSPEVLSIIERLNGLFGDLSNTEADTISDAIEVLKSLDRKCQTLRLEHECIASLILIGHEDANSRGYDEGLALCQRVSNRALISVGAK